MRGSSNQGHVPERVICVAGQRIRPFAWAILQRKSVKAAQFVKQR